MGAALVNNWDRVLRKRNDVVARQIAGEALLIPVRGRLADMQRIFALDATAEFIWQRIDGKRSLNDIAQELLGAFKVAEDQARRDLLEFVGQLTTAGLIEEEV
jgi:hypothetical protein